VAGSEGGIVQERSPPDDTLWLGIVHGDMGELDAVFDIDDRDRIIEAC
jgi:hypothetical protein